MNIAFVASQGGHLGQIRIIFTKEVIGKNKAILITESEKGKHMKERHFQGTYRTYFFDKDVLRFNPLKYLKTLLTLKSLFQREKIDLVITNGAQLSIPAVVAARLGGRKVIFIDTIVRTKTPNWSARFCYFFSNIFIVQHKSMVKKYGKRAIYRGGIL